MSQWQPIETAPEKGCFLARWGWAGSHFQTVCEKDKAGVIICSWDHKVVKGITHWMPLPEPPQP